MRGNVVGAIQGAGLAGAMATVIMAFLLLIGVVSTAVELISLAGALGAVAFTLDLGDVPRRARILGALAVGTGAALLGAVSGFGWLEVSGVFGALVAGFWISRGMTTSWRPSEWMFVVVISGVALVLLPLVIDGGTLGHDESAYGLMAKSWLFGTPESGWNLHRGIGMSIYAYPILALGGEEAGLRSIGWLSLLGLAAATWWLGRQLGDRWVGPLAALTVLASPTLLKRATEYLSDIPAAALLMVCMVIVWKQFTAEGSLTYRLLWVLPFAWVAFYLRYQSLLTFVLILMTVLVLWWPKVVSRPGPLITTASVGSLGLIPHFVFAASRTDSPLGILTYTTTSGGRDFSGDGLFTYVAIFGWAIALFLGPILIGMFAWWLIASRHDAQGRTRSLFLFIPAFVQVLALGILGEAHARFVFFPYALVTLGGVVGISEISRRWDAQSARALTAGFVVLLVGVLGLSVVSSRNWVEARTLRNEPLELASYIVNDLTEGQDCSVMTSYAPQITFYSECVTDIFRPNLEPVNAVERLPGEDKFMILLKDGKRQPEGEELDRLIAVSTAGPEVIRGERDWADLYRFAP